MFPTILAFLQEAAPAAAQAAQGGQGGQQGAQGCAQASTSMMPILLIFAVFYIMLIRPQQKKQREHDEWLKSLKKGDDVVTSGGVIGKITGIQDNVVTVEVQEKVRMRVLRSHISGKVPAPGQPGPAPEKK
jgi:preprotein translocase subunit YajC